GEGGGGGPGGGVRGGGGRAGIRRGPHHRLRGDRGGRAAAAGAGRACRCRAARARNSGQALVHGGRPLVRRLCGTVLIMEAVVVALAIVPSITLGHMHGGTAGAIGGALAGVSMRPAGWVGRAGGRSALCAGAVCPTRV